MAIEQTDIDSTKFSLLSVIILHGFRELVFVIS